MDIKTSKSELIDMIMQIESIDFVESLKKIIMRKEVDFWDELADVEKEEIEIGIKQLDNKERISFDDYMQRIEG